MHAHISPPDYLAFREAGVGLPVVLLHAFPLSHQMWADQAGYLSGDFRVIAPDLRGFGSSPGFAKMPTIDEMALDVCAMLDKLHISKAFVGGLSMGGYVALSFARLYPERLAGLVLMDTKATPDDEAAKAKRKTMIDLALGQGAAAVAEAMVPNLLADGTLEHQQDLVRYVLEMGASNTGRGLADGLVALRDRANSTPVLASIAVPTLVLCGEEDKITPPDVMEAMAEKIEGSTFKLVPGAGHLPNLENPEVFNAILLSFLRSASGLEML